MVTNSRMCPVAPKSDGQVGRLSGPLEIIHREGPVWILHLSRDFHGLLHALFGFLPDAGDGAPRFAVPPQGNRDGHHAVRAAAGTAIDVLVQFRAQQTLDAPGLLVSSGPLGGGREVFGQSDERPAPFLFHVARDVQLHLLHQVAQRVLLSVHDEGLIQG